MLQLDNKKSKKKLKWKNVLTIDQTADLVASWYYDFYTSKSKKINTINQIKQFMKLLGSK